MHMLLKHDNPFMFCPVHCFALFSKLFTIAVNRQETSGAFGSWNEIDRVNSYSKGIEQPPILE